MHVPMCEPNITEGDIRAVTHAMRYGEISGEGKFVKIFEDKFAEYIGTKHAVAVSSGWAALFLSCWALVRGKTIVIPDITMIASANAAKLAGAEIILGEVDKDGMLDYGKVSGNPDYSMPVHLWGKTMPAREKSIEDCAEALGGHLQGRKAGSMGKVGCFSFYANKHITTGEGGMITTNDEALAQELRSLRSHYFGKEEKYIHPKLGFNLRMTSIQAALGISQLERVDELVAIRQADAQYYFKELAFLGDDLFAPEPLDGHAQWHYVVHTEKRDELCEYLKNAKIESRKYFTPLHRQPEFISTGDFKMADRLSATGLLLPRTDDAGKKYVCDTIKQFFK